MPPRKRGQTVPVPSWWTEEAERRIAGRPYADVGAECRPPASADQVGRTIRNRNPTLSVVIALSDHLGLPCPVVIAATKTEAIAIERALEDVRVDSRSLAERVIDQSPSSGEAEPVAVSPRPTGKSKRIR